MACVCIGNDFRIATGGRLCTYLDSLGTSRLHVLTPRVLVARLVSPLINSTYAPGDSLECATTTGLCMPTS